jgi:hypothetical protein
VVVGPGSTVTNTDASDSASRRYAGVADHSVLLFLTQEVRSIVPETKLLKHFKRVPRRPRDSGAQKRFLRPKKIVLSICSTRIRDPKDICMAAGRALVTHGSRTARAGLARPGPLQDGLLHGRPPPLGTLDPGPSVKV